MLLKIFSFIIILFLLQVEIQANKKFKVKLMTLMRCKLPDSNWSPEHPPLAQFSIKKIDRERAVINANITIVKKLGPVTLTYRTYQLQQNAVRNLVFKLEKVHCTNPMTFKIVKMLGLNISTDCYVLPGSFTFKNLDIDKLSFLLTKSMSTPGRYAYEVEFNDNKGVLSCYDLVCDLVERK